MSGSQEYHGPDQSPLPNYAQHLHFLVIARGGWGRGGRSTGKGIREGRGGDSRWAGRGKGLLGGQKTSDNKSVQNAEEKYLFILKFPDILLKTVNSMNNAEG